MRSGLKTNNCPVSAAVLEAPPILQFSGWRDGCQEQSNLMVRQGVVQRMQPAVIELTGAFTCRLGSLSLTCSWALEEFRNERHAGGRLRFVPFSVPLALANWIPDNANSVRCFAGLSDIC